MSVRELPALRTRRRRAESAPKTADTWLVEIIHDLRDRVSRIEAWLLSILLLVIASLLTQLLNLHFPHVGG